MSKRKLGAIGDDYSDYMDSLSKTRRFNDEDEPDVKKGPTDNGRLMTKKKIKKEPINKDGLTTKNKLTIKKEPVIKTEPTTKKRSTIAKKNEKASIGKKPSSRKEKSSTSKGRTKSKIGLVDASEPVKGKKPVVVPNSSSMEEDSFLPSIMHFVASPTKGSSTSPAKKPRSAHGRLISKLVAETEEQIKDLRGPTITDHAADRIELKNVKEENPILPNRKMINPQVVEDVQKVIAIERMDDFARVMISSNKEDKPELSIMESDENALSLIIKSKANVCETEEQREQLIQCMNETIKEQTAEVIQLTREQVRSRDLVTRVKREEVCGPGEIVKRDTSGLIMNFEVHDGSEEGTYSDKVYLPHQIPEDYEVYGSFFDKEAREDDGEICDDSEDEMEDQHIDPFVFATNINSVTSLQNTMNSIYHRAYEKVCSKKKKAVVTNYFSNIPSYSPGVIRDWLREPDPTNQRERPCRFARQRGPRDESYKDSPFNTCAAYTSYEQKVTLREWTKDLISNTDPLPDEPLPCLFCLRRGVNANFWMMKSNNEQKSNKVIQPHSYVVDSTVDSYSSQKMLPQTRIFHGLVAYFLQHNKHNYTYSDTVAYAKGTPSIRLRGLVEVSDMFFRQ